MVKSSEYLIEENKKTEGSLTILQMDFAKSVMSFPHKTPLELSKEEKFSQETNGIIERLNYLRSILYRIIREIRKTENFEEKYLKAFRQAGRNSLANQIKSRENNIVAELTIVIHEIEEYMRYWMDIRDTGTIPKARVMRFVMKHYRDLNYFSNTKAIDVLERILARERKDVDLILQIDRRIFYRNQ